MELLKTKHLRHSTLKQYPLHHSDFPSEQLESRLTDARQQSLPSTGKAGCIAVGSHPVNRPQHERQEDTPVRERCCSGKAQGDVSPSHGAHPTHAAGSASMADAQAAGKNKPGGVWRPQHWCSLYYLRWWTRLDEQPS